MKDLKKEKLNLKEILNIITKSLKISLKTKSTFSIIVSVAGFAAAFLPVLISNTLKKFTDLIQAMATTNQKNLSAVFIMFAMLAAFFILQAVFNFLQSYTTGIDTVRTNKYIRKTILKCTCEVKYKYIENYDNFKQKIAFIDTYAGNRVAGSMQNIIIWIQNIITFMSIFYVLVGVNAWIVFILLITCIPSVILAYKHNDKMYIYNTKWIKEGTMIVHYFFICIGLNAMAEVRHWRIYDYLKTRWREIADSYLTKKNNITKKHVFYNSIADVLKNIVYIGVLLIAAYEIYKKPSIGLGIFMLIFTLSGQLQDVTSRLLIGVAQFGSDIYYMKDFFEFEKLEKDIIDKNAVPAENATIEFKNVDFTYPNSTNKVLKNINVTIHNGEKIAIVGENGSGKSTFVNLICGMYEPDSGVIEMNGKNIQDNLTEVRRSISAVCQDFGHYEATIKENITVSDYKRNVSDAEIYDLAKKTDLYDVIKSQPDKLNEEIGMFSKNGNNLSGGQWQKLAITRAAYRSNAKIMILDEPTAALDPIAETRLYKNFANLTKDKTTLFISHRLGITSIVDRILVFKDGEILEDGSHNELMKNNGYYAKMYRAQAQWYDNTVKFVS